MDSTTFLEADVPADRLAHGYLWRDEAFVEEPIDPYGAFASMGGVFTSVRDLAKWAAFFLDAYPPRDDPERLIPLSRASRREMQQGSGPMWPDLTLPSVDADPAVRADGYGFGLFIEDHLRWGRIVTHSGGYPGFGSNMRWQPSSGLGVVVLANHRYGPSTLLARQLMDSLLEAQAVAARPIRPAESLTAARVGIDWLLGTWDDEVAERLFAMNVDLDEPIAHRRDDLARIRALHGDLRPDPEMPERSDSPLHATWWLAGALGGRVRIEIRLDPEAPSRVQTFTVTSVPAPSETLQAHAARLLTSINGKKPAVPAGLMFGAERGPAGTRSHHPDRGRAACPVDAGSGRGRRRNHHRHLAAPRRPRRTRTRDDGRPRTRGDHQGRDRAATTGRGHSRRLRLATLSASRTTAWRGRRRSPRSGRMGHLPDAPPRRA